jgi:imidazolonepropionase-like amidohydrolase
MTAGKYENNTSHGFSRRDFLKISGAALAASALPLPDLQAANLPARSQYAEYHQKVILLTNCNVIDVKTGKVTENSTVLIENGKIKSVGKGAVKAGPDVMVFDLKGAYVIPGLIDGHTHLTLTGVGSFKISHASANVRQMDRNLTNHISSGVTTVRDLGSIANILHKQIAKVDSGKLVGPRVVYCNRFLNVKGGHPSITPSDQGFWAVVGLLLLDDPSIHFEDMAQLRKEIGPNLENGASFIKLTLDDKSVLCGKKNLPVYSDDMLTYIFDYADKKGVPVSGHHQHRYGFSRALSYPINSLEHVVVDEELPDGEVEQFVMKGTGIVPTLSVGNLMAYPEYERYVPAHLKENEFVQNERKIRNEYLNGTARELEEPALHAANGEYAEYYKVYNGDELLQKNIIVANPVLFYQMQVTGIKNINKLKDAGALIGCGTDAGVPYSYHGSLWYEMAAMNRAGFTPVEVLRCATVNNARILHMDDRIGSLEEGKLADVVVLEKNPLEQGNLDTYRTPLMTFRDGQLLYSRNALTQKNKVVFI